MMSYEEFVRGYQLGGLRCGVSMWLILWLFFAGEIREKKISLNLLLWSLSFPVLIVASVIGFLHFPFLWALLGTVTGLVIYALVFFYQVGDLVLSSALADEKFYEFARAKRVLWIYSDGE
jgi:hypothetical protein